MAKGKETRIRFTRSAVEQQDPAARPRARPMGKERYLGSPQEAGEGVSDRLQAKQRSARAQSAKLSFQRAGADLGIAVSRSVRAGASGYENDNAGTEALYEAGELAETGIRDAASGHFSRKLHRYDKAKKLEGQSRGHAGEPSSRAGHDERSAESSETNPQSRWRQRQAIKKEYAEAKTGKTSGTTGVTEGFVSRSSVARKLTGGAEKAGKAAKDAGEKAEAAVKSHPMAFLVGGVLAVIVLVIASAVSSCSGFVSQGGAAVLASTYTAEDEDIRAVEAAYCAMEERLRERAGRVEEDYPGYDAYEIHAAEIGHDPYELAAFLTVLYEDYTLEDVREALTEIFEAQYGYSVSERTEMGAADVEETVAARSVLTVEVVNRSLVSVVQAWGLSEDEMARYRLLAAQRGNREYLFEGNIYANPTTVLHYDVPGEALSDVRFARMIQEGEKYLGYPYVWGGSSPATSFDCSGFVSWVINHSGNGWSVGRPSAEGLRNLCAIIPASEARPGDLVFFQGTYETAGASHVGIYVGDGMMLHCGNPIQYASIETSYWQQHFLCFGRLPA